MLLFATATCADNIFFLLAKYESLLLRSQLDLNSGHCARDSPKLPESERCPALGGPPSCRRLRPAA